MAYRIKAPIQRNVSGLDPRNMLSDHDVSITKFKRVLTTLKMLGKFWKVTVIPFWNYLDNLLQRSPLLLYQISKTMILSMIDLIPFCILHGTEAKLPIIVESSRRLTNIIT